MLRSARPLVVLALALLAAAPAHGQQLRAYGIKLGPTVSSIRTDLPTEDPEQRIGFSAFVFGEWSGPGRTGVMVEAGYLERGYSVSHLTVVEDGPMDAVLTEGRLDKPFRYLSLAAMTRVSLPAVPGATTYVFAGPRVNALVGGRRGEDVPGYDYRPVVWDASFGVGAEGRRLLAEVRVNAGLNDALTGEGWRESAYHRAVDFIVGVRF